MIAPLILAAAIGAATPTVPAEQASFTAASATRNIFENDWVLMNWALKAFDSNHDQLLSPGELTAAAGKFRSIADTDGDGQVTRLEYNAARDFILARY